MAGVWTIDGINELKKAIANGEKISFTQAVLNLSDSPLGSIELNAGLKQLPNPFGSFVPFMEYDENTSVLYARISIPPMYGFPSNAYVNGIGLYVNDVLAYVEQIVPRKVINNSALNFKIKINLDNYQNAYDVNLVAFSYNASMDEDVSIDAGGSYSRSFATEVKEVEVYVKNNDGTYSKNSNQVSVSFSSDFKTITLKNNTSEALDLKVFYLVSTNPIPENITLEDLKRIVTPIYSGSQPPAPTDDYLLMFYTPTQDLYWADREKNRWLSITEDLRRKIEIFWEKVVLMHSLDLAGRFGLNRYLVIIPYNTEGINLASSNNVELFKDAVYFDAYKGTATLTFSDVNVSTEDGNFSFLIDVLGNRTDKMKFYYQTDSVGRTEISVQEVIKTSGTTLKLSIEVPYDATMRLSPAIYGFVIISDKKLSI